MTSKGPLDGFFALTAFLCHASSRPDIHYLRLARRSDASDRDEFARNRTIFIAILVPVGIIAIILIAWVVYLFNRPLPAEGEPSIFARVCTRSRRLLPGRRLDPVLSQPTPFRLPETSRLHLVSLEEDTKLKRTSTWVDLARLRAASYHREDEPVCIDLPDHPGALPAVARRVRAYSYCITPNLSAPQETKAMPERRSCDDLNKEVRSAKCDTKPSYEIHGFSQDQSLKTAKSQQGKVLGLGLDIGTSSSWRVSSESLVLALSNPTNSRLVSREKSFLPSFSDVESPASRIIADGGVNCCDSEDRTRQATESPAHCDQDETIEKYTGPTYADQIANVLSEANLVPLRSRKAAVHSQEGEGDLTELFHDMMELLQGRVQIEAETDGIGSDSEGGTCVTSSTSPLRWLVAPVMASVRQQVQCNRQPSSTSSTMNFHLPLRISDCDGGRTLCCTPSRVRSGSLQIIKVRPKRASLIPGMHISSASLDSDTSSNDQWTEVASFPSQRLFQEELSRFSFSSINQSVSLIKTYYDEEREVDAANRQSRHRQKSSSLSMIGLVYPGVGSHARFSSLSYADRSDLSRYSQESNVQDSFTRLSLISGMDDTYEVNLRQLLFDINPQIRRQSVLSSYARTCSPRSSTCSISSYRSGLESFRLSTFPSVPPLSFGHPMLSSPIGQKFCRETHTAPERRLSRGSHDSSDNGEASASSSSQRESDFFSPTMSMLELYEDEKSSPVFKTASTKELP